MSHGAALQTNHKARCDHVSHESNPRPLAPKARIIPLDQQAIVMRKFEINYPENAILHYRKTYTLI